MINEWGIEHNYREAVEKKRMLSPERFIVMAMLANDKRLTVEDVQMLLKWFRWHAELEKGEGKEQYRGNNDQGA